MHPFRIPHQLGERIKHALFGEETRDPARQVTLLAAQLPVPVDV